MRHTLPIILASILSSISSQGAAAPALPWKDAAPTPQLPSEFADLVMRPVVVALPDMDDVRYLRDQVYTENDDPNLRLDLYLPGAAKGRVPVVLFVHGGADTRGKPKDWGIYQSWGRLAASSGLAGITFTHRLGFPRTRVTEGAADVEAALAFIGANAERLGLDAGRICIVAYSAGGPMLAPYMVNAHPAVRCLIGWYPFMDIRQSTHHQRSESTRTLQAFSNILRLDDQGTKTPLYLVRAGRDEIPTLLESVDRFAAEALRTNYPITIANHPDGAHGFDNQLDDARSREIVLETLSFLRRHLASEPSGE